MKLFFVKVQVGEIDISLTIYYLDGRVLLFLHSARAKSFNLISFTRKY